MDKIEQNIYDDDIFFNGYKAIRDNTYNANNLEEKPALFALLPNLEGKNVLDLGCGYGENCTLFAEMGAAMVMGIDISQKMLTVANEANSHPNVIYHRISMNNLTDIGVKFDVIVSSLAVHYIEDFDKLVQGVRSLLTKDGIFLFSQEHPIALASVDRIRRIKGRKYIEGTILTDYVHEGERHVPWIVDDVIKYHRKMSTIINVMAKHGFCILAMDEPSVSDDIVEVEPKYSRCWHSPDFLVIKAQLMK